MPRSTYYWHQHGVKVDRDAELKERVSVARAASYHSYGYRRILTVLRNGTDGQPRLIVNHKRLRRVMKILGIRGKPPTRNRYNSFEGADPNGVNILDRDFRADRTGQILVTDITMFRVGAKNLYFSPLIDVFNIQVLSWRLSTTPDAQLCADMLREGLEQFPLDSVQTIQTDQGIQYQAAKWAEVILDYGAVHSMSRVGNCHDNAPAGSFFARVKTEFGRGEGAWSVQHFRNDLAAYIQWWNEERIMSRIGTSPLRYLERVAA